MSIRNNTIKGIAVTLSLFICLVSLLVILVKHFPGILELLNFTPRFRMPYITAICLLLSGLISLKIDQAFVTDIDSNQDNAAIVKAIISMAKSLQLKVIAEGIKTNTQLQFLKQNHCDEGQGFYFSKPLDPQECEKILQKRFVL